MNEDLHVLITVEDTRNRCELKLIKAVEEVKKLLVPSPEGEDDLKKMQLMELAILNGTYRDNKVMFPLTAAQAARFITSPMAPGMTAFPHIRSPTPAGAPIILAPARMPVGIPTSSGISATNLINGGGPPPLVSPSDSNHTTGLMYNPYAEYQSLLAPGTALLEYPHGLDQTAAGMSLSYVR